MTIKILDVQNLVETQTQIYRERNLSQFSRLLDSKPSFATYYSIDGVNSSTSLGSREIMAYITTSNDTSPIKYKKINGLPMYSVNAITATITYDEISGTYTNYEEDALILNSIIKPLPGDAFIIPAFSTDILFIVADVQIRSLQSEDHYVIHYTVMPNSRIANINSQVTETYETYYRNIGTEDKVLIRTEDYNLANNYTKIYSDIAQRYLDEFYDEDYGYIKTPEIFNDTLGHGSCKYLIKWLMDNTIIYFDDILNLVFAFEEVLPFKSQHNKLYNMKFPLLQFIKKNVQSGAVYINFKSMATSLFTVFKSEAMVQAIDFKTVTDSAYIQDNTEILLYSKEFPAMISSKIYTNATPLQKVIAKFVNNEDISLDEFNAVVDDYTSTDIFRMYFLPLVLLILQVKIKALKNIKRTSGETNLLS